MLNSLERKIGWLTVQNLPLYIVSAQGLVYIWTLMNPGFTQFLELSPMAVFQGHEYWRLLTFLFISPIQNAFFEFFFLYLMYVYGNALEESMGSFGFTLFYLIGALGTMIAGLFFGSGSGAFFLNTTLFLAFAAINPNFQILLFFIIPVKIKWLAWLTWAWLAYTVVVTPFWVRISIVVSLLNYFLFFGKTHYDQVAAYVRRKRFERISGDHL
jgi:membrane associated rhomboid family serine protease